MSSPLTTAMSQQDPDELRELLDAARTVAQRAQIEVELIEEALSRASQHSASSRPSPQAIRERILRIVGEVGPAQPKAIRQALADDSINAYNALAQLVRENKLVKRDGLYEFPQASPNGHEPVRGDREDTGLQVATG
jgi:hypothetical protein